MVVVYGGDWKARQKAMSKIGLVAEFEGKFVKQVIEAL